MVVFWSCFGWETLLILRFTEKEITVYHVYELDFILGQNSATLLSLLGNMSPEAE